MPGRQGLCCVPMGNPGPWLSHSPFLCSHSLVYVCKPAFGGSLEHAAESQLPRAVPDEDEAGGFMEGVRQELEDLERSLTREMALQEPVAELLGGGEI